MSTIALFWYRAGITDAWSGNSPDQEISDSPVGSAYLAGYTSALDEKALLDSNSLKEPS